MAKWSNVTCVAMAHGILLEHCAAWHAFVWLVSNGFSSRRVCVYVKLHYLPSNFPIRFQLLQLPAMLFTTIFKRLLYSNLSAQPQHLYQNSATEHWSIVLYGRKNLYFSLKGYQSFLEHLVNLIRLSSIALVYA